MKTLKGKNLYLLGEGYPWYSAFGSMEDKTINSVGLYEKHGVSVPLQIRWGALQRVRIWIEKVD